MVSITKRGKKWRARASYVDARGIRQQPSKTFDTKKSATEWATRLENQIFDGSDINAGKILFPEYFKEWVKINKKDAVRASTYMRYESAIKRVNEMFDNIPLDKLTAFKVQEKINNFGETHTKAYSHNIVAAIKLSLHDAFLDGIIKRDISPRLKASGKKLDDDHNYLDEQDFIKLQNFLYDKQSEMPNNHFYLMALIALETGARVGEIQALTSQDITPSYISIDKSYSAATKETTAPKTSNSIRRVTITPKLYRVIEDYLEKINSQALFPDKVPSWKIREGMKELSTNAHVAPVRFHGLRHSHVSYLLNHDIDIQYISKRVGHANVNVTLKTYAHLLKEKELAQDELTLKILSLGDQ